MAIISPSIALIMAAGVYFMGTNANWHWAGALTAALAPIAFAYLLGHIGILIAGAFTAAIWKATRWSPCVGRSAASGKCRGFQRRGGSSTPAYRGKTLTRTPRLVV
ncbi:MAG: hypothetical protein NTW19_08775 [Planctomycetota bacterium]|nr:hypothetical protein [Planctomycetota bacterium]